jgi:RNA polymerase sigma-70 factor (ECF subfamily)
MENLTDSQLVTLYMDGNTKAFDGLILRYGKSQFRFAFAILKNQEDAHDCVQESFIKAWKNIKKFDESKSFKTWIFTITKRTALDILRKKRSISFSSMDDNENDITFAESIPDEQLLPDKVFEQSEGVEIIGKILDTLTLENKTIILLHHAEEMTFEEIAEILEKPMNTVKSQYRRSLIQLRKELMHQNYQQ